ncbi:MAG: hypothetical protein ABIG60_04385 [Patescibacteria group bacterium]
MIAVKKQDPKKTIVYIAVIAVIFIFSGWMLYSNFFANKNGEGIVSNITEIIVPKDLEENNNKKTQAFSADELDFLTSRQFQQLVDNNRPIIVNDERNNYPFQ